MSTTLLDTIQFEGSLSKYINENNINKGTPSLLKFITNETKDYNDIINGNKQRALKDNVTDAFVQTFFINDDNITKMLVDYQYHFIHSKLMGDINSSIMMPQDNIPINNDKKSINSSNLYPLKNDEHIILNFKGGSTMYYLFKNLVQSEALQQGPIDKIKDNFKISDIDLSLTIDSQNITRYYQLESIVTHLVIKYMEELTNRFECILLKTISNDSDAFKTLLTENKYTNIPDILSNNNIFIADRTSVIYEGDNIYKLKANINELKLHFNPRLILKERYRVETQEEISGDILALYKKFINFDGSPPTVFTFKTVDLLELSLLIEFVSYIVFLKYDGIDNRLILNLRIISLLLYNKIQTFINYLLNNRYDYLLNNLYNETKIQAFITKIKDNLIALNNNLTDKAIKSYSTENPDLRRKRMCGDHITNTEAGNYYDEYKYVYESKSGTNDYYNIKSNENITATGINIEGRPNFALIPQDKSYYPYLLVSTNHIGNNHSTITDFKGNLHNVTLHLPEMEKNFNYDTNKNNVHYVALNKSIMTLNDSGYLLAFNLCRIKFNITVSGIVEKVKIQESGCTKEDLNSYSVPSEFLDVSINSKFDSFHMITKEIEHKNQGMIFNFLMPSNQEYKYGNHSRIMSYNLKTFAADLNNILYNQQKIPWLDNKYGKRLLRLMFYLFNVQHQHYMIDPTKNQFSKIDNQISILNEFISSLDTGYYDTESRNYINNKFTYENIVIGIDETGSKQASTRITIINEGHILNFQNVTDAFIKHLSKEHYNISINSDNIIDIILNKKINDLLMFKPIYKYGDGFYSYTIIYVMIVNAINIDMNKNREREGNLQTIINKYAEVIKYLYTLSDVTYDISNYGNIPHIRDDKSILDATNNMNQYIVRNFISQVAEYIRHIKDNIAKLTPIFTVDLQYKNYEFITVE